MDGKMEEKDDNRMNDDLMYLVAVEEALMLARWKRRRTKQVDNNKVTAKKKTLQTCFIPKRQIVLHSSSKTSTLHVYLLFHAS